MEFMEQSIGLSGAEDAQGESPVGKWSAHGVFRKERSILQGLVDQVIELLGAILESLTGF